MPEPSPSTLPHRQRLKLKLLLPMGFGLLLILLLYVASTSWYLNQEIKRDLQQKIAQINASFNSLLEQRAQIMQLQLEQLAESELLQQLMRQRDRKGLLSASQPTFRKLLNRHISHFYFHTPQKSAFLRVHNPGRFGDRIDRFTLQQAAATGQPSHGIELGPLGTFTLRAVLPWYHEGELLGYLELGEEIELLVRHFFRSEDTILTQTIEKRYLDRRQWSIGMQMLGKDSADWDLLPDRIIVQSSRAQLLPAIVAALKKQADRPLIDELSIEQGDASYRGQIQPLIDAAGHHVGDFIVLRDISATMHNYWRTVLAFSSLCLLAAGVFLLFGAGLLGRTEKQQAETDRLLAHEISKVQQINRQLSDEIEERKTVEAELGRVQNELEKRVAERTEQLWLALEQTQEIRKQLSEIVSSVPDGLIVVNAEQQILLVNPRAEELFQCSFAECVKQPLRSIIRDPALANRMEDALQHQLNDFRFDAVQIGSDLQTPVSFQARTSTLTDSKGQSVGMIFLIHDISQEREVERLKSEFISTAVHELSTPLTAILGFSEFLLENRELSAEEEQEFLSIINEKADFLSGLVGELLDISRIESGKPLPLQKDCYSAHELFEKPIAHLHQLSTAHQFRIELEAPETKLAVDKEKIWQVMENLCSNAVKYSPAGGLVTIRGRESENSYRVTVSDQGIGLTKDQAIKVFEKFYRCNQTDTAVGGTGLGLTIVKYIIESHDGQIWIDSELGQGTSVHFVLPKVS